MIFFKSVQYSSSITVDWVPCTFVLFEADTGTAIHKPYHRGVYETRDCLL